MSKAIPINSAALLRSFLKNQKQFQVLYSTRSSHRWNEVQRLCVLDSSFNPPHLGHASLATKAVDFQYKGQQTESKGLLLLLSVKNADKIVPVPASFESRIDMMCLMADKLSRDLDLNVTVALTNHAKFVDKAEAITKDIGDENKIKLTFIVGYDTLIRIFDAKYYKPKSLEESLNGFIAKCDLIAVTRSGGQDEQMSFVENIKNGNNADIPPNWSKAMHIVRGDDNVIELSSSAIRAKTANDGDSIGGCEEDTFDDIAKYINSNRLYVPSRGV